MSSQYSFPILTNAEILACLAELDIAATEDHLLKPTPETARAIYEPLVLLLVGVTRCTPVSREGCTPAAACRRWSTPTRVD
jgi:hypothetical protein